MKKLLITYCNSNYTIMYNNVIYNIIFELVQRIFSNFISTDSFFMTVLIGIAASHICNVY